MVLSRAMCYWILNFACILDLNTNIVLCVHMFSGAFHAGNHAGFEEQRYEEDPRLRPWAYGETEEAAEDSGEWFLQCDHILFKIFKLFVYISEDWFRYLMCSFQELILNMDIVFYQDVLFCATIFYTTGWRQSTICTPPKARLL